MSKLFITTSPASKVSSQLPNTNNPYILLLNDVLNELSTNKKSLSSSFFVYLLQVLKSIN